MAFLNRDIPQPWSRAWLVMWAIVLVVLPLLALPLPFDWWPNLGFRQWRWVALGGFFLPEAISLISRTDALPPLTQTIRHFLPGWFAFIYIYFMVGAAGATWLGFSRFFQVGLLFGLLGWLTEHFTFTYTEADPRPPGGEGGGPRRRPM